MRADFRVIFGVAPTMRVFVIALCLFAAACTNALKTVPAESLDDEVVRQRISATPVESVYRLDTGDRLRVIVFGEEDLSGEFQIDGEGDVALPLIGQVGAGGLTVQEFQEAIAIQLRDGYLNDPKVSVEVLNFRPYYILGEVEEGGEFPFQTGMTVLNAVAIAGGFTYRANKDRVAIVHKGSKVPVSYVLNSELRVLPGDIITIEERIF